MFGDRLLAIYSQTLADPLYLPIRVAAIVLPIIISILLARIANEYFLLSRIKKAAKSMNNLLFAVDIPKNNEQNLVAVEQIYVNLTAIKFSPNILQRYVYGFGPLSISLELISLEGYIQFLVRTPEIFKDIVISSIYAQYPGAEITPVEDYVSIIPDNITADECPYKMWGTDFILNKPSAYPLRTYRMFEHEMSDTFNDPLTPLLEAFSHLSPGENAGLQIIITPSGDDWKKDGANEIKKFLGVKVIKETSVDKFINLFVLLLEKLGKIFLSFLNSDKEEERKITPEVKAKSMVELTPGEKNILEQMQKKLTLPTFYVSMRYFYLAKKELYSYDRGISSVKGAMSQFGRSDLNSLGMHGKMRTDANYFFIERRVKPKIRRVAALYKARSRAGAGEFYLSTEELATLYHFPSTEVKTPMLPRAMIKRSQPPTILPTVLEEEATIKNNLNAVEKANDIGDNDKTSISNLSHQDIFRIVNSLPGYDFDNDYYEERFAIKSKDEKTVATANKEKFNPPDNLPIINE
jgi:hypothetical protein